MYLIYSDRGFFFPFFPPFTKYFKCQFVNYVCVLIFEFCFYTEKLPTALCSYLGKSLVFPTFCRVN